MVAHSSSTSVPISFRHVLTCVLLAVLLIRGSCRRHFNIAVVQGGENPTEKNFIQDLNENFTRRVGSNSSSPSINITSYRVPSHDASSVHADVICRLIADKTHVIVRDLDTRRDGITSRAVLVVAALHNIPIIGLQDRDSKISDKSLYPTFLRLIPPFFDEARRMVELVAHLKWNKINVIMTDNDDGRLMYVKIRTWAYEHNILIEETVFVTDYHVLMSEALRKLNDTTTKVNVVMCDKSDAAAIFEVATELNLTRRGFVWIVGEEAANSGGDLPDGSLFLRLRRHDVHSVLRDAVSIVVSALSEFSCDVTLEPSTDCDDVVGDGWQCGSELYDGLIHTRLQGITGKFLTIPKLNYRSYTFFYRQLGCLAFSLRFWPKIKHLLSNCPASDLTFSSKSANFKRVKIN